MFISIHTQIDTYIRVGTFLCDIYIYIHIKYIYIILYIYTQIRRRQLSSLDKDNTVLPFESDDDSRSGTPMGGALVHNN